MINQTWPTMAHHEPTRSHSSSEWCSWLNNWCCNLHMLCNSKTSKLPSWELAFPIVQALFEDGLSFPTVQIYISYLVRWRVSLNQPPIVSAKSKQNSSYNSALICIASYPAFCTFHALHVRTRTPGNLLNTTWRLGRKGQEEIERNLPLRKCAATWVWLFERMI